MQWLRILALCLWWRNAAVPGTELMALLKAALCLAVENTEDVIKKGQCPLLCICLFCFLVLPFLIPFWKSLQPSSQAADLFLFALCLSEMTLIQLANVLSCGDSPFPPSPQPGTGESRELLLPVACANDSEIGHLMLPPGKRRCNEQHWFHQRHPS